MRQTILLMAIVSIALSLPALTKGETLPPVSESAKKSIESKALSDEELDVVSGGVNVCSFFPGLGGTSCTVSLLQVFDPSLGSPVTSWKGSSPGGSFTKTQKFVSGGSKIIQRNSGFSSTVIKGNSILVF